MNLVVANKGRIEAYELRDSGDGGGLFLVKVSSAEAQQMIARRQLLEKQAQEFLELSRNEIVSLPVGRK